MVFSIGFSGVSAASTQMMMYSAPKHEASNTDWVHPFLDHSATQHEMAMMHDQDVQSQSLNHQPWSEYCQQMMQHHVKNVDLDQSNNINNKVKIKSHQQHQHCPDCSVMACQAMLVWLNTDDLDVSPFLISSQKQEFKPFYQAQYPSGHWQRILRPPKA